MAGSKLRIKGVNQRSDRLVREGDGEAVIVSYELLEKCAKTIRATEMQSFRAGKGSQDKQIEIKVCSIDALDHPRLGLKFKNDPDSEINDLSNVTKLEAKKQS
jgi:hypothetical protein